MDSFELNKILGAVLATCLGVLSINICRRRHLRAREAGQARLRNRRSGEGSERSSQTRGGQTGTDRATARQGRGWPGRELGQEMRGLPHLHQGRAPSRGSQPVGHCRAPEGLGAGLQLFGRAEGQGRNWSIDDLNQFINNPRGYVPGTNMTFAGVSRGSERADVIAYLNTLSDNPAPLPKAAEATVLRRRSDPDPSSGCCRRPGCASAPIQTARSASVPIRRSVARSAHFKFL